MQVFWLYNSIITVLYSTIIIENFAVTSESSENLVTKDNSQHNLITRNLTNKQSFRKFIKN